MANIFDESEDSLPVRNWEHLTVEQRAGVPLNQRRETYEFLNEKYICRGVIMAFAYAPFPIVAAFSNPALRDLLIRNNKLLLLVIPYLGLVACLMYVAGRCAQKNARDYTKMCNRQIAAHRRAKRTHGISR